MAWLVKRRALERRCVNHEPIRISPRHLHRPRVRRQTIISLALIGCTTLLAWNRILDTAAWSLMVTTVGAAWASRRRPARQPSRTL